MRQTGHTHEATCLHHITIINDNSRTVYPTQPWRWNYQVTWGTPTVSISNNSAMGLNTALLQAGGNQLMALSSTANAVYTYNCSGSTSSTFTAGTYDIGGQIIHLQ